MVGLVVCMVLGGEITGNQAGSVLPCVFVYFHRIAIAFF